MNLRAKLPAENPVWLLLHRRISGSLASAKQGRIAQEIGTATYDELKVK